MSFQAPRAVGLAINAIRKSAGSLCTTPPGTRGPLTETPYRLGAKPRHNRGVRHHSYNPIPGQTSGPLDEIGHHGDANLGVALPERGNRQPDSQMTEHTPSDIVLSA
jgi:hypothetical protein